MSQTKTRGAAKAPRTASAQEVAVLEPPAKSLEVSRRGPVGAIIPQSMSECFELAQAIVIGGMAPKSFNNKPEAVMVAIMHGMEVGFTPLAAVQSIAVINGFPTIWGDGAIGLVRSSGLLEDMEETIVNEGGELVAYCRILRRGQKTPIVGRFSWSDAKRAGLHRKPGPWLQYPQRMMPMRARSWALRDGFADVLRGLRIAEEGLDMGEDLERDLPPTRPTRQQVTAARGDFDNAFGKPAAGAPIEERPATEEEEREADRMMRRQAEGEPLEDPGEPEPELEQEPVKVEVVKLYSLADDKGKADWPRYVGDCLTVIATIDNAAHLKAWREAHAARLNMMPPSLADSVRAKINAKLEEIGA